MARKKKRITLGNADEKLNNGLASLLANEGFEVRADENNSEVEVAPVPEDSARWKVRVERKGRKGKTVTVVSKVQNLAAEKRRLQKKFGCGVHIEGDELVLQGDHSAALTD